LPRFLKPDKSIRIETSSTPDGYDTLVAAVDGYVHEDRDQITVKGVLELKGNIDYSTGHIDFIGDVRIGGDVHRSFNVRAGRTLEISGSVHGDNVLVAETSITVKGNHQGGDKGSLLVRGDYSVGVAQRVRAEVRGSIRVQREARDCVFRCGTQLMGRKASLVGGSVWCVDGLEVASIGNEAGLPTTIELRNHREVTEEYETLESSIKQHRAALSTLGLHLGPYAENRTRLLRLSEEHRNKLSVLIKKYDEVKSSLLSLQGRAKRLREIEGIGDAVRINALEVLHDGVSLAVAGETLKILDSVKGPVSFGLKNDGTGLEQIDFKPLEEQCYGARDATESTKERVR
jgi:uncharacterized protein (DUF342 family)